MPFYSLPVFILFTWSIVIFARVIVSRNGNIPIYKSAVFDVHMFDDEDTFDPQ